MIPVELSSSELKVRIIFITYHWCPVITVQLVHWLVEFVNTLNLSQLLSLKSAFQVFVIHCNNCTSQVKMKEKKIFKINKIQKRDNQNKLITVMQKIKCTYTKGGAHKQLAHEYVSKKLLLAGYLGGLFYKSVMFGL